MRMLAEQVQNISLTGFRGPGTTWAKDRNLLYIRIFWVSAIVLQVATAVALTRTTDRMAIGLLAIASAAALVTTLCLTARRPLPMPDATLKGVSLTEFWH